MSKFPIVAACFAVFAPVAPVAQAGYEDVLPSETLAFVGVDDVGALRESFEQTSWGRFLNDAAFESLRSWMDEQIGELAAQAEAETGTNPFDLVDLVEGPAAAFLLDIADPNRTMEDGQDVPVAFGMMLGTGQNGEAFLDAFAALWVTESESGNVLIGSEEIAGVEVTLITDADADATNQMEMRYGVKDDTFIMTMISAELADRAFFDTICAGLDDLVDETLSNTDRYQASLAGDAEGGITAFANVGEIVNRAVSGSDRRGRLSSEDKAIFDVFGFDELGAAALHVAFSDAGSWLDAEFTWEGQGFLGQALSRVFGAGELVTPGYVPAETLSSGALRMNLAALIDVGLEIAREIAPDEAAEAEAMMEMMFQQEGFNVRDDIIDNLAGEIGFFQARVEDELDAMPGTEEDPMSIAVLLPMKDGARLETAVDRFLRDSGLHATRKRDEFQGVALFTVPLPLLGSGLHYAIVSDLFAVSLSREMLEDTLRRHGGADVPSLIDSDGWAEATALLDGQPASSVSFQDAAESVKGLLAAFHAVVSGEIPGVSVGGTPARNPAPFDLPDPELAHQYFEGTSVTVLRVDAGGIRITSTSP